MNGRRTGLGVAAVLAVVLLGVVVRGIVGGSADPAAGPSADPTAPATTAPPTTVPSLLGLDARTGVAQLRAVALVPSVERVRPRCGEPAGTVLGTGPTSGTTVVAGDRVRLRVAASTDGDLTVACADEGQAWELLRLARGVASDPALGVRVVISDGNQHQRVAAADLGDRAAWRACPGCPSVLTALATAAASPAVDGVGGPPPTLVVTSDRGPLGCGRRPGGSAVRSVTVAVGVRTPGPPCQGLLDVGLDADGRIVAVTALSG